VKIWPFVGYYVEKKRNTKKIFSVLFPQQFDDYGLIGVAKIGTNEMSVNTVVFEVFI